VNLGVGVLSGHAMLISFEVSILQNDEDLNVHVKVFHAAVKAKG
jgi:hypothetical protein